MAGSSSKFVTVGCKLPNGIVAQVGDVVVTFNGTNTTGLIGGHGITENVDAEFWKAWLEKNEGLLFVRNELVFAHAKASSTKAQANNNLYKKTGLEPADPEEKQGEGGVKTLKVE